uniref:Uncharacterized protein n=1 Tax=Oryza glaberrima TaxID=4538 RepID=I1NNN0_ORYGL
MAGNHISLEEITEYESVITKEFRSEDEGYKFYNDYAWSKGFSIRKDNVRYNGDDFNDGHAHPLAKHDQVAFLRSHRNLSDAQKAEVVELGVSGLRTCNIMDVMEKNHGGYDQIIGYVHGTLRRTQNAISMGMRSPNFVDSSTK